MSNDLLPCNATPQERALSEAIARLSGVPVTIREVWSPDNCPADLLPWLAWGMSVDEWDSTWTDTQKRGAIRASFYVHQRKGTIGSVRAALNALGLNLEIVEWFNDAPAAAPYTFRITIGVDQDSVSQQQLLPILSIVDSTKNLRSHLAQVAVNAASKSRVNISAVTVSGNNISVMPE